MTGADLLRIQILGTMETYISMVEQEHGFSAVVLLESTVTQMIAMSTVMTPEDFMQYLNGIRIPNVSNKEALGL